MELLRQIGESAGSIQGSGMTWGIINIAIGALGCFLGYKLLRMWIVMGGLMVGGFGAYYIISLYSDNILIQTVVTILAAVIISMIAYNLYLVGVFLLCSLMGLIISCFLLQPQSSGMIFLCVAISVLVGVLAVRFVKPVVILSTSLNGGLTMAMGIAALTRLDNAVFLGGIGIAIGVFGCLIQLMTEARKKEKEKE